MNELVGTWKLVAFEELESDGVLSYPYGRDPIGLLIYTATGHMSVQVMRSDRRLLPDSPLEELTADQVKEAVSGFTGFCGTYTVDSNSAVVIHHVQCHVFPGSIGKHLKRTYEIEGDRLVLKPAENKAITWERIHQPS